MGSIIEETASERDDDFSSSTTVKTRVLTLSDKQVAEAKEAFGLFDLDSRGELGVREVKMTLRALGVAATKAEVAAMMDQACGSQRDFVTIDSFLKLVTPKMLQRNSKDELMKIFSLFDEGQTGTITWKSLKRVAVELGENISDKELQQMVKEADVTGDGLINKREFARVMRKTSNDPLDVFDDSDDDAF